MKPNPFPWLGFRGFQLYARVFRIHSLLSTRRVVEASAAVDLDDVLVRLPLELLAVFRFESLYADVSFSRSLLNNSNDNDCPQTGRARSHADRAAKVFEAVSFFLVFPFLPLFTQFVDWPLGWLVRQPYGFYVGFSHVFVWKSNEVIHQCRYGKAKKAHSRLLLLNSFCCIELLVPNICKRAADSTAGENVQPRKSERPIELESVRYTSGGSTPQRGNELSAPRRNVPSRRRAWKRPKRGVG